MGNTLSSLEIDSRRTNVSDTLVLRLKNPKIVTKVVEKVVEKKVEVPTEIYRDKIVYSEVPKEVVHTDVKYFPIYSDDPELLKHQVVKPKKTEKKPFFFLK